MNQEIVKKIIAYVRGGHERTARIKYVKRISQNTDIV